MTKVIKRTKATKSTLATKGTTVRRASDENLDHMAIVSDYIEGTMSVSKIAAKHSTTMDNVSLIAKRTWKSLTNMRESQLLTADAANAGEHFETKVALKELHSTELVNQEFRDKLSDPESNLLTDEEATYAWIYVHTGDIKEALEGSLLNIGLYKEKDRAQRFSYERALQLRGYYLNAKVNVSNYITELREKRLIDADVGKARIQSELIEQIEQMKTSGQAHKNRMASLRAIELLGKTVGAFVERVEITEVNPNDALDRLIELASEADITEVTQ
jgi:hypothetical protein